MALQVLCVLDAQGDGAWPAVEHYLREQPEPEPLRRHAVDQARLAHARREGSDQRVAAVVHHWDVGRMNPVDRCVLRLALLELDQPEMTPPRVVLNEAIELAKEFGGEESGAFVNGVLDAIYRGASPAAPTAEAG